MQSRIIYCFSNNLNKILNFKSVLKKREYLKAYFIYNLEFLITFFKIWINSMNFRAEYIKFLLFRTIESVAYAWKKILFLITTNNKINV